MRDYRAMWSELGLGLDRHDALLAAGGPAHESVFLSQPNRPQAMGNRNSVIAGCGALHVSRPPFRDDRTRVEAFVEMIRQ